MLSAAKIAMALSWARQGYSHPAFTSGRRYSAGRPGPRSLESDPPGRRAPPSTDGPPNSPSGATTVGQDLLRRDRRSADVRDHLAVGAADIPERGSSYRRDDWGGSASLNARRGRHQALRTGGQPCREPSVGGMAGVGGTALTASLDGPSRRRGCHAGGRISAVLARATLALGVFVGGTSSPTSAPKRVLTPARGRSSSATPSPAEMALDGGGWRQVGSRDVRRHSCLATVSDAAGRRRSPEEVRRDGAGRGSAAGCVTTRRCRPARARNSACYRATAANCHDRQ
jgi:hypothetical protein